MSLLALLPLPWLRALGAGVGQLLFVLVKKRRQVVLVNLDLCFPELSPEARQSLALKVFKHFAQAWLDRAWIWHGSPKLLRKRLRWSGAREILKRQGSTQQRQGQVIFAPHFWGLDAAWTLLTLDEPGQYSTIFTPQSSKASEAWMTQGRSRFGEVTLNTREDGVKKIIQSLRQGGTLYLLPDMNFGPEESIFVDFFGHPAATVPSLSKFARLGRAQVVPVVSRMSVHGYDIEVHPAWSDFPTQDAQADTQAMNHWLEKEIQLAPEQYLWMHKRFKTRPQGEPPLY
jgi:KDO2-lipid IV(A) lauroyltransferase